MGNRQVGQTPGPKPRGGPTMATGTSDSTGCPRVDQSRATGAKHLRISHWNAEGVRNKKLDLQAFLKTNQVDVCCIQKTHLTSNHRFTMRGYETYRHDREGRSKGGVLTLVKNNIPSALCKRSEPAEDTEYIGVKLITSEKDPLTVFNLYSPPDKAIQLDSIQPTANADYRGL